MKRFRYILAKLKSKFFRMRISEKGLSIIKKYEGLRLRTYICPAGKLTIGYGHTRAVTMDMEITEEQAEEFLRYDVMDAENTVNSYGFKLNQCQFDALVSFVFNVGSGNFAGSTLLKKIRKNVNDPEIAAEFQKWVYSLGKKLSGLEARRKDEAELYFSC